MDGEGAAPPDAATNPPSTPPGVVVGRRGFRVEHCNVFKSRLQEYAQKAGLPTPEYRTVKEGPSHEPVFKSTVVVVNNAKYDSLPGFFTRKAAEQSAAEVALLEIASSVPATAQGIRALIETGLCKNLLQEYAQKMNYTIPSYDFTKPPDVASFICTVEIGGVRYIGAAARTKKEAAMKAARIALLAIQGQSEGCANGGMMYIVVPGRRRVKKEAEKRSIETPKQLKVKRGGYKKKWNKRKFMRKADRTVDAETDGGTMARGVHDTDDDVPMQQAIIPEERSTNGAMSQCRQ